jgi:hypothetical protein
MSGSIASASYAVSSSYAVNADLLDNRDSSTFANTGSNIFSDGQYLSSSFNPTGFSTTASLYTDGGLRVTRDAYISGTLYLNNVTVFGTQSVAYISSSQLNIGTNLITVNTDTPSIRFGGLAVYDSGSTGLTGSLLWDSQNNHWIYSNPSGSSYSGGMFISGPRTSTLGSETGTTACMLLAGQGGDHLTSSMIYHSSTVTCIPNTLIGNIGCFATSCAASIIGGTISGTTIYGSTAVCSPVGKFTSCIDAGSGTFSGNMAIGGTTITDGSMLNVIGNQSSVNIGLVLNNTNATYPKIYGIQNVNNNLVFYDYSASSPRLTIASSGAATFACSISATSAAFSSTLTGVNAIFSGRLGAGISSDQNYASLFIGGDITTGVNQYAIITDPQLSGTSNSYAVFANARIKANTAVTNAFGVYIPSAEKISGATITNNYALYIANQTSGATLNYSIYSSGGLNYFGGSVGLGTTSLSTEANLFLGAQGVNEGGQMVFQKGTSCSCATHLDNYEDKFRILVGTDTSSNAVHFQLDHKTRCATFYGGVRQTASSGALVYQRIAGIKAAAGSGNAINIAYVGHTHTITVRAYARLNDSNAALITQVFSTAYGSSVAGASTVAGYNLVSSISLAYNNSGYTIQVTPIYSSSAPDIYFTIEGISHDTMYVI